MASQIPCGKRPKVIFQIQYNINKLFKNALSRRPGALQISIIIIIIKQNPSLAWGKRLSQFLPLPSTR